MIYIFLDIDGVLNCDTTKERCHGIWKLYAEQGPPLPRRCP